MRYLKRTLWVVGVGLLIYVAGCAGGILALLFPVGGQVLSPFGVLLNRTLTPAPRKVQGQTDRAMPVPNATFELTTAFYTMRNGTARATQAQTKFTITTDGNGNYSMAESPPGASTPSVDLCIIVKNAGASSNVGTALILQENTGTDFRPATAAAFQLFQRLFDPQNRRLADDQLTDVGPNDLRKLVDDVTALAKPPNESPIGQDLERGANFAAAVTNVINGTQNDPLIQGDLDNIVRNAGGSR